MTLTLQSKAFLRRSRNLRRTTCSGRGDGARSSVEIALIDRAAVGDTLLVHAGTALLRLTVAA